jgi:hypothetical protein
LCLLWARAWKEAEAPADPRAARGAQIGFRLVGPTLVAGGLALAVAATRLLALPRAFVLVPAVLIGLGVLVVIQRPTSLKSLRVPVLSVVALGAVYVGTLIWVIPQIEAQKVVPDLARWVREAPPVERVATFRLNRWNPAFRFYVDRHVELVESDEDARRFFSSSAPYYCVMESVWFDLLRKAGVPLKIVYSREGLRVTSGRMLWRQPANRTTFVVTAHESQAVW